MLAQETLVSLKKPTSPAEHGFLPKFPRGIHPLDQGRIIHLRFRRHQGYPVLRLMLKIITYYLSYVNERGVEIMTIKQKVLNTVSKIIDSQNEKGLQKYGESLDECDLNKHDWNLMIIEELIDALQYQQKEINRIKQNSSMSLDVLTDLIVDWGIERDLHKADPSKQFLKVAEEFGEIAEGLAKDDLYKVKDGIGDTFVTLVMLSLVLDVDIRKCVLIAYKEIIDRKGKMINGVFVKESDLND